MDAKDLLDEALRRLSQRSKGADWGGIALAIAGGVGLLAGGLLLTKAFAEPLKEPPPPPKLAPPAPPPPPPGEGQVTNLEVRYEGV